MIDRPLSRVSFQKVQRSTFEVEVSRPPRVSCGCGEGRLRESTEWGLQAREGNNRRSKPRDSSIDQPFGASPRLRALIRSQSVHLAINMEKLQARLQAASAEYQKLQGDLSVAVDSRQRLDSQLQENEMVKKV